MSVNGIAIGVAKRLQKSNGTESNYRPQPAGISDVTLDQGLEKLVEVMAENVREVWGQE